MTDLHHVPLSERDRDGYMREIEKKKKKKKERKRVYKKENLRERERNI